MNPIVGLLIAVVVGALILLSWYIAWLKPHNDRKSIANETPIEAQAATVDRIFTGAVEVSLIRAETRLTDHELNEIALRHGYTFARTFQTNRGGAKEMIFRRLDAGPGRRFGRARGH